MRMVSPCIEVEVLQRRAYVLVDTGSEVLCISENLYNELRNECPLIELPVCNMSVYVAVGRKATPIRKQIQLTMNIDKHQVNAPFLVVSGLPTEIIVGIDWLNNNKVTVDIEHRRVELLGEYLPQNIISFYATRSEVVGVEGQITKINHLS